MPYREPSYPEAPPPKRWWQLINWSDVVWRVATAVALVGTPMLCVSECRGCAERHDKDCAAVCAEAGKRVLRATGLDGWRGKSCTCIGDGEIVTFDEDWQATRRTLGEATP